MESASLLPAQRNRSARQQANAEVVQPAAALPPQISRLRTPCLREDVVLCVETDHWLTGTARCWSVAGPKSSEGCWIMQESCFLYGATDWR